MCQLRCWGLVHQERNLAHCLSRLRPVHSASHSAVKGLGVCPTPTTGGAALTTTCGLGLLGLLPFLAITRDMACLATVQAQAILPTLLLNRVCKPGTIGWPVAPRTAFPATTLVLTRGPGLAARPPALVVQTKEVRVIFIFTRGGLRGLVG